MPGEDLDTAGSGASSEGAEMPVIDEAMNQGFAGRHDVLQQTLVRFNDGSGFAGQESKQSFLLMKQQYNAIAQNLLEQDGLAARIAQMKMAGVFPNNLASSGGVVVTPTQGTP